MAKWIIMDLDNCCADDEWRIKHIDWSKENPDERYDLYHKLSPYDAGRVPPHARKLMDAGAHVAVFTARPSAHRALTTWWIKEQLRMRCDLLLMREEGDLRPSEAVKESMLEQFLNPNNILFDPAQDEVIAAYDDHPEVVAMYKRHNINAHRSAMHCVQAHRPPPADTPLSAPDALAAARVTFAERNALYKSNYTNYGAVMAGLFPDGLTLTSADDWNRLALVFNCTNKLSRYTQMMDRGGHRDSAQDLIVYAAMLQEVTK